MFPSLIVSWRTEPASRGGFQLDPFDESIERKIEVQARLFAVSDHIKACLNLVMNGDDDRVLLKFGLVGVAKFLQVLTRELEPARKRITSNDSGAQGPI